jgi:hypothetical protein
MKPLLLLAVVSLLDSTLAQTSKHEPTKAECHSAYEEDNALVAMEHGWMDGGSKGPSPLSRYSIGELNTTGDLLSHCSAVDTIDMGGGNARINGAFIDLMQFFQTERDTRVSKYISRHHLWDDIVKEDAAGLGRE